MTGAAPGSQRIGDSLDRTADSQKRVSHKSPDQAVWDRRRVLVCAEPKHRELIARGLAEKNYDVFVAEDTEQAIERMRESQVDVVILDSDFDAGRARGSFRDA